jgi:eukaryotic-like serine/threonine-protein kinase
VGSTVTSFTNQDAMTIGKYRLIAELGHGGMSDVFLAVSKGMGGFHKLLVIKQLRPNLAEDEEFLSMFLDEARLAARLSHRNVVATYEVGEDGGRYYIAMEYLEGQALKRIIHRAKTRFGLDMHLQVVLDVLKGLHHAHDLCDYDATPLGVVHRDVSPHNIFVTYAGDVKVVDFGVAKALDSSTETSAGVMKGKLAYMSPEQARSGDVDRRADIFSVGVLLWEGVTGQRMWGGETSSKIAERLLAGDIPDIRKVVPDIPDGLARICERALALDVDDRYPTALEMHDALASYVETSGVRITADELGHRVEKIFSDERLLMQTIIERQLSRIREPQEGDDAPVGMVTLGRITTGTRTPTSRSRPGDGSQTERSVVKADKVTEQSPSLSRKGGVLAAITVVAVVVAFLLVGRNDGGTDDVTSVGAVISASASASNPLVPPLIRLRIAVRPENATVFLDDVRLSSNPYEQTYDVDTEPHRIRAEAPGYATETREVRFDSDVLIHFSLAPAAAASELDSGRHVVTVAPATPTSVQSGVSPATEPTKRPLDPKDPWAP